MVGSKCTNRLGQNDPTNTIEYTLENNIEKINGAFQRNAPDCHPSREPKPNARNIKDVDYSFLRKQVSFSLSRNDVYDPYLCQEVQRIIQYFFQRYYEVFRVPHVKLSQDTMDSVVSKLLDGSELVNDVSYDTYCELIDRYFISGMDCDYHITHFVSGHIRDYRLYESGMGGGELSS